MSMLHSLKNKFLNLKLTHKISWVFIIVIIIPLIISNIWIILYQKSVSRQELERQLEEQIHFFEKRITQIIKDIQIDLINLFQEKRNLLEILEEDYQKAIRLSREFLLSKEYERIYLCKKDGSILLEISLKSTNINKFSQILQNLKAHGKKDLEAFAYFFREEGLYVFVELPIIYRGTVYFVITSKLIPWYKVHRWGNFSSFYLTFYHNSNVSWTNIFKEDSTKDMDRKIPQKIFSGLKRKGDYFFSPQSVLWDKSIFLHKVMYSYPWEKGIVALGISLKKQEEYIWFLRKILYGTSLVVLILIYFAGYLLSRFITQPLQMIAQRMGQVIDGDYNFSITYKSEDEIGYLVSRFQMMVFRLQEREKMKKYLSKGLIKRLESGAIVGGEAGELRVFKTEKTVLFSDIRDFTTLVEKSSPEEVFEVLNEFYNVVTLIGDKHHGIVDKYMGDSVMLLFEGENGENDAVIAALEMKDEYSKLTEKIKIKDWSFAAGIGIASGYVIEGSLGNDIFKDYTVVGDAVNLASRLEKLSQKGSYSGILVDENVYNKVSSFIYAQPIEGVTIKGKNFSTSVFEIICLRNREELEGALDSEDKELLISALKMIGSSNNIEFLDKVLLYLKSPESEVRRVAIDTVWSMYRKFRQYDKDGSIREKISFFLVALLFREKEPYVRSQVIRILGIMGDEDMLKKFEVFLTDEDDRVRANAIEVMGKIRDKKFLREKMLEYIKDSNHRVRAAALEVLWSVREYNVVIEGLEGMIYRGDSLSQSAAFYLIGQIFSKRDYMNHLKEFFSNSTEKGSYLEVKDYLRKLLDFLQEGFSLVTEIEPLRQLIIAAGKSGRREMIFWILEKVNFKNYLKIQDILFPTLEKLGLSIEDIELLKFKLEQANEKEN